MKKRKLEEDEEGKKKRKKPSKGKIFPKKLMRSWLTRGNFFFYISSEAFFFLFSSKLRNLMRALGKSQKLRIVSTEREYATSYCRK